MKKLIALLAASMLLTSALASCGSDSDSSEDTTEKAKSSLSDDDDEDEDDDDDDDEEDEDDDDDDDEEEDTTSTTKSKKTTSKVTTERSTIAKITTEPASKERTTEKKPASQMKHYELSDNSPILGKWTFPEEMMSEFDMDTDELPEGMEFKDAYMEFTDDNMLNFTFSLDMSSAIYLDDDGLHMMGMSFEDFKNTGSQLIFTYMGEEAITFDRIGAPDKSTIYGKYDGNTAFNSKDDPDEDDEDEDSELILNFEAPGKSSMEATGGMRFEFDEKNSLLYVKNDEDSAKVEFNGKNMKWITDDGETVTLERLD